MELTKYEKETIIIYNDADKEATIYTCNNRMKDKLAVLCSKREEVKKIRENNVSVEYSLPKKWVQIRPSRILTDEEREEMRNQAIKNFSIGVKDDYLADEEDEDEGVNADN